MTYQTHTLPNGLRLIHKPDGSPVTHCGVVINTGSRDEEIHQQGMAHFIEHMLFKGTEKRRSSHIINRLENVGGELNAFTSKEETVVYATVLNEYSERAIELLSDIVQHSTFPQKEIDKEVVVIIDEIQSYNDSPSELIYDEMEELVFPSHSLGRNILGTPEFLTGYTSSEAIHFVSTHYLPHEMVFFVVGNLNFGKLLYWLQKYFNSRPSSLQMPARVTPLDHSPIHKQLDKNTHQTHFMLGTRAYDLHHQDRLPLYLLNNIVGGPGMNSLLNLSLREKHGLVYTIESSFQPFTDAGLWTVYFGCDNDNAKRCEQLVYKELQKLREKLITDSMLKKYKLQLLGQMAIASENKENLALSMAKSYLRYDKIDELSEIKTLIELITANQLRDIANKLFEFDTFSTLIYK